MQLNFPIFAFSTATLITSLQAQAPTFEVAVAKPNHTGSQRSNYPRLQNGTFSGENVSLKTLLSVAYGLSGLRILGPAWLDSDRFDFAGKAPEGVADTQIMPLLQTFLHDRFAVEIHRELKDTASYDMIVAKGGVKIQLFDPAHPPKPLQNPGGGAAAIVGAGTMSQLADMLAYTAGKPVVDRTALAGRFYYALIYAPLSTQPAADGAGSAPPDFFQAVPDQLGLKLEPKKQPIDMLVVDHAERLPIPN